MLRVSPVDLFQELGKKWCSNRNQPKLHLNNNNAPLDDGSSGFFIQTKDDRSRLSKPNHLKSRQVRH